ncbi:hypothetical protein HJC23_010900 [Cyclotella cryptica]|uniref:Uncharacterized protein n=1 Tax=Cyclotella cryptica TaxID=29204 RepID=A0ABD3Q9F8_9STRA
MSVNGSAAYKSILYSLVSTVLYYFMDLYYEEDLQDDEKLTHPYTIAALVAAFIFLLSSKVTFSYNRVRWRTESYVRSSLMYLILILPLLSVHLIKYWEACTALHSMQSKWLDAGSTLAAYHLQSSAYESVRPPCFGEHSDISDLLLERERSDETTPEEKIERIKTSGESTPRLSFGKFLSKEFKNKCKRVRQSDLRSINHPSSSKKGHHRNSSRTFWSPSGTLPVEGVPTSGSDRELLPSLFLQESAHLVSLLSAVALSTLRNEIEGVEAPLSEFVPGNAWPTFNSNDDPKLKHYGYRQSWLIRNLRYIFDISRTPKERAAYNMARPFHVIGGVSEREAYLLQQARGALAKVALVNMWFNEFVIREHLHGSTGNVGPPIISRVQQYQSDGFLWYNSARKLSYIPFPFPHSQITTLFVLLIMFLIPVLMISFASFWLGLLVNFFTVTLFAGLNEVSKELEYPYRCMPNDLPLNIFQAHLNEALLTTFAGYHPDSYWEVIPDT